MSPFQLAVDHCRFLGERGRALPSRSLGFWRSLTSLIRGKRGKVRILEVIQVSKFNKKFIASITPW